MAFINTIVSLFIFQKCLSSQIDFRAQQCAAFNMKLYRRKYFTWTPFNKYSRFGKSCTSYFISILKPIDIWQSSHKAEREVTGHDLRVL